MRTKADVRQRLCFMGSRPGQVARRTKPGLSPFIERAPHCCMAVRVSVRTISSTRSHDFHARDVAHPLTACPGGHRLEIEYVDRLFRALDQVAAGRRPDHRIRRFRRRFRSPCRQRARGEQRACGEILQEMATAGGRTSGCVIGISSPATDANWRAGYVGATWRVLTSWR